ncbi:MAG: S8 family serine peptidase, partial [Planctomycetota bacterium]
MRAKVAKSMLAGVLVVCLVSAGLAGAANDNAGGPERVPVLIGFRQTPGPSDQALVRAHGGVIKYTYTLVPGIAASVPRAAIDGLSRNPNVTMVDEDLTVHAIDAELDNTWGVKRIGAGAVHNSNNKGTGIKVAVIDTGIDYTHPDLDGNYAGGKDFVNNDDDPMDDHYHGTHVAGTIAAEDDGFGVVGVAPEARLYGLKVLSASGSGNYSDIIAALQWAVNNGMQVTNNSYGSSGDPGDLVRNAFNEAAAAGIVNVCAAGNSGNVPGTGENMIYPAKFASCIAVAATTSSDVRASFSSTGSDMTLAAPGANILSTFLFGLHLPLDGTSMACPHVAGAAALCIAAGVSDVEGQLIATADDLGEPGWDPWYGHGLVNVAEAVGVDPGDDPVDNPPYVFITSHYDFDIVSGTVGVTADASDDNGVTQVEFFVDGTTVSESIGVDTDNTDAHYGVTWDSTAVTDDLYIITATATDTTGQTASYSIFVFVSNAVNNSPVANDDADTTQEGTPVIIDVLANDSDVDGDPLTVTAVTEPANGTASINPDNTVTYTPDGGFTGDDTFTYTVEDDSGGTDSAQVNVTVTPTNDPPDALDDSDTTDEDTLVTIDVLSNDSDPDIGDTLTVTAVTQPADGTATINPDNTVNYTPDLNFNGGDTFTYTISDGKGGTDTANVSVTVVPVNDSPVANDDVNTTQEDTPVIIDVLANDTDVD